MKQNTLKIPQHSFRFQYFIILFRFLCNYPIFKFSLNAYLLFQLLLLSLFSPLYKYKLQLLYHTGITKFRLKIFFTTFSTSRVFIEIKIKKKKKNKLHNVTAIDERNGGSNSRDTTILFSSNRIESKSRLPPSQNTEEKWNDGEGIGNRFRWATRRIDEKKWKERGKEKRIREEKGRRGEKHHAQPWMDENRFSYIDSSIVNFASTNLDRQNILGTLWFHELELENIPETWKIANLFVRRNFFSTIGIDSAREATILFSSKRRYRLPRLLFTEHGSPSVEVADKSNKLSPPTLDRVFRDTWRASKPRVSERS